MIINGKFCPETHVFKTAEAARAFCKVHKEFCAGTCGDAGYAATKVTTHCTSIEYYISGTSDHIRVSALSELEVSIRERRLSYKNIIKACIMNSLMGTRYRVGYGEELPSNPVIFTYALGCVAPKLILWLLVYSMLSIVIGTSLIIPAILGIVVVTVLEFLIPWINSYSVYPIEDPWLLPWLPVDD